MSHNNLKDYYGQLFTLKLHKYSATEVEAFMPWERDMIIDQLAAHLEAQNKD